MKEKTKENLFLGLTAARLAQGYDYSKRVMEGKSIKLATAGIIGVDLLDGILARKAGADGPARRATDSVVDSGIVTAGLSSIYKKHPESRPYVGALAVRELLVAGGWAKDLIKTKQVKKGDDYHKLPFTSIAAFGIAAHHGSEKSMKATGIAAIGINAALAYDYFKGWKDPNRTRRLDSGVVEVAGFYDARKMVHDIRNAPPQLEAGESQTQLEAADDPNTIEVEEFIGQGELPEGAYQEITEA